MAKSTDMGKVEHFDQADKFMGVKPFATIGPDRDSMTASKNITSKLKKKKAQQDGKGGIGSGSSGEEGETANADGVSKAINKMMEFKHAKK